MGVDRQSAAALMVAGADEILGLAALGKAEFLQLRQHEGGEMVIDHRRLDVLGGQAALLPELLGNQAHFGQSGDVIAVIRGHDLLAVADTLGRRLDDDRLAAQVAGAFDRSDDHGHRAVRFLAAIEQVQRLADPARGLMISQRDRLAIEKSSRIGGGEIARRDCNATEILAGRAVAVHIALREHADPGRRGVEAIRHVPAIVDVLEQR